MKNFLSEITRIEWGRHRRRVDGSSLSPCESISLAALVGLIYRGLFKWSPFGRLPAAWVVLTPLRAARWVTPRGDRMNERSERIGQHGGKRPNANVACGDPAHLNKSMKISAISVWIIIKVCPFCLSCLPPQNLRVFAPLRGAQGADASLKHNTYYY